MIPPCLTLSNIKYISRVKWSNPGKRVAPSPTPWCSSYWKENLLVASLLIDIKKKLTLSSPVGNSSNFIIPNLFRYPFDTTLHTHICVCMYVYMYVYIYIYIYIYIYMHATYTPTDRYVCLYLHIRYTYIFI